MSLPDKRVVVAGAGGVGKSAVTVRFVQDKFYTGYDPTKEDYYTKQDEVDGIPCSLDIHDTPGEEDWSEHKAEYIQKGECFMLIYAINMAFSFDHLSELREQILRVKDIDEDDDGGRRVPMIIVGNKCDLEEERTISTSQGADLAKAFGCPFFEASAKCRTNITECWHELVRQLRMVERANIRHHAPTPKKQRRCILS